jgi:hypothetical protein
MASAKTNLVGPVEGHPLAAAAGVLRAEAAPGERRRNDGEHRNGDPVFRNSRLGQPRPLKLGA